MPKHIFLEKSSYLSALGFVILSGYNHFITWLIFLLKTLVSRCTEHVNIIPINSLIFHGQWVGEDRINSS